MSSVEVITSVGPVKGSVINSYNGFPIYTYQGIPYAKPPVGNLRFKDPVPIERWTKVYDATKAPTKAACPNLIGGGLQPGTGEDCLYLNIFAPKPPSSAWKLPVMVWLHGGGFLVGDGNRDSYGPDYLVPKGVILVSINYRLGALGFLSFQNEECPGNFGLKDQSQGLRWIQDNIVNFGGNPGNVTIFGESAGAVAVHYHTISPLSRGLFHKAIAQSGASFCQGGYSRKPVESGLLLAKRLGCNTSDPSEAFEAIRNASVEDILNFSDDIKKELEGQWDGENIGSNAFIPVTEPEDYPNAFITKTPAKAIADGDTADIPYIQGVCSAEMMITVAPNFVPDYKEPKEYQKMLPKELDVPLDSEKSLAAAKKLKEFYFPNGNTQADYIRAQSSVWMNYGVFRTARAMSSDPRKKSSNYLYIFDATKKSAVLRNMFKNAHLPGSCHCDDLEFLFFPFENFGQTGTVIESGTPDVKTMELVTNLWTNFAKTGVPDTKWPKTTPEHMKCVRITTEMTVEPSFFGEEMKFWDDIYSFMQT